MKRYIKLVCIVFVALSVHSCSDWLTVQPSDRQTEDQLFATKGGFYAALNGIYTNLNSNALYGKTLSYEAIEILARRYVIKDKNEYHKALLNWSYSDSRVIEKMESTYQMAFKVILNCNTLLKNIESRKNILGERDYKLLKGEVLGVRAFIHFDMLRMFGPIYAVNPDAVAIPYSTSAIGTPSDIFSAKTVIEEYILKDIAIAEELLQKSDPVVTEGALAPKDIEDEKEIYNDENTYKYRQLRFNYYALLTLKARVQLYKGDNIAAATTAKNTIEALNANKFFPFVDPNTLLGNTTNPDRMFSSEVLFCLYNRERSLIYTNYFDPEKAGDKLIQPRTNFVYNLIPVGEYRRTQWGSSSSSSNVNPVIIKHKDAENKLLFHSSIVPLIRVSELYLIAAEADVDYASGYRYLNNFKAARGANPAPIISSTYLNSEILLEYCREFYAEGQMFFYLKRRNISLPSTANGNGNSSVGFLNRADRLVIPLPASETDPR